MQDIHDIRGPVLIGLDPRLINGLWIALAVLSALLLAYFLIRYIKKRKNRPKQELLCLPMPLPAHETALRELDTLADLMAMNPRMFYFRLTGVLKFYMGKHYGINAPEMTTPEIVSGLSALKLDKAALRGIRDFFNASDNIKYAGRNPARNTMEADDRFVRRFIAETAGESSKESFEEGLKG